MGVERRNRIKWVVGVLALMMMSLVAWGVFGLSLVTVSAQEVGDKTAVGQDMVVAQGEEVKGDAVVTNGKLTVLGEVVGDAIVVNGKATIEGIVHGDVTVTTGDVELGKSSQVDGNVLVIGGKVIKHPDAKVRGDISAPAASLVEGLTNNIVPPDKAVSPGTVEANSEPPLASGLFSGLIDLFGKGMVSLVLLVLGLGLAAIIPRRVGVTSATLEAEPVPSLIVGAITGIVLFPVVGLVAFILFISIVGWLLLPVLAVGVVVALLFGLVTVGAWIGRAVYDNMHHAHSGQHDHLMIQVLIGMSVILGTTFVPSILLPDAITALMLLLLYFAACVGIAAAILSRFGTLAPPPHARYSSRVPTQPAQAIYHPGVQKAANVGPTAPTVSDSAPPTE